MIRSNPEIWISANVRFHYLYPFVYFATKTHYTHHVLVTCCGLSGTLDWYWAIFIIRPLRNWPSPLWYFYFCKRNYYILFKQIYWMTSELQTFEIQQQSPTKIFNEETYRRLFWWLLQPGSPVSFSRGISGSQYKTVVIHRWEKIAQ